MSKYSAFFAILNKNGLTKEEVILEFTQGKSDSLSKLSDGQYNELMRRMQKYNGVPPGNDMRRKMIAIAKSMNWGADTKKIMQSLDAWALKQKYRKTIMRHTPAELSVILTIFESKVYPDYLRALNR